MVALILETMLIVLSAMHTSNTVEWQSPFYFLLAHDKLQPRTSITIEAMNIAQFKPALGQRVLFGEQELDIRLHNLPVFVQNEPLFYCWLRNYQRLLGYYVVCDSNSSVPNIRTKQTIKPSIRTTSAVFCRFFLVSLEGL